MPHIIAGIYEIEREIGSGGGGTVFLAKHLRLNKQVVLKRDNRSLTAQEDVLRREVDSLKNINHTYIPQVYDYVAEHDAVYTVMDYVEGESLDMLLERGESFSQARIVAWARQLLEAVVYLHGRPPHGILHADIKPANIMLTPNDEIRLIDFNIALLLGEGGAIIVGRSFGYASPEHYDMDYIRGPVTHSANAKSETTEFVDGNTFTAGETTEYVDGNTFAAGEATEFVDTDTTERVNTSIGKATKHDKTIPEVQPSSSSESGNKKLIDARSDIYSIGATLYHLITGERPERNAVNISSVLRNHCSPALAAVVAKAMNPSPDMRYQSASDMLRALLNLRNDDPRVRRWKRVRSIACAVLAFTFITGALTAFSGWRLTEQVLLDEAEREAELQRIVAQEQRLIAEEQRVEAELQRIEAEAGRAEARLQERHVLALNSVEALRLGDRYGALALALEALPCDISSESISEVRRALTDALGVYDLSDGFRPHRTVTLPAEKLKLAIAPNGETFAAISFGTLSIFNTDSGELLAELPTIDSGLADVIYADDNTIIFAGADGVTAFSLSTKSIMWTGSVATTLAISADGGTIAAVNRNAARAAIYGSDGTPLGYVDFGVQYMRVAVNDRLGNPGGRIFALNHDGSLLAVSFSGGGLEVFGVGGQRDIIIFDYSEYTFFEGGFFGRYFAFSATNAEESHFEIIDTATAGITFAAVLPGHIGVFVNESGVFMSYNRIHVQIDPQTAQQVPIERDPRELISAGRRVEGNLNTPIVRVYRLESHADKAIFAYDPEFEHIQVRLNYAGDRVMMFSSRNFRIYDIGGELINEIAMLNSRYIHAQHVWRSPDASYLKVTYIDGTIRRYSAENGEFLGQELGPVPDPTLFEVFYTDSMRIESPLHGSSRTYNLFSGELIRELDVDALLAFVTQVGQYVITEYITVDGHRFGLLIDGTTAETLAYIPNLSDIIGTRLIINDRQTNTLRETRLFSEGELIEMARMLLS